jgi:chorismate synthase
MRYLTAGESHGKGLVAILEGFPVGIAVNEAFINAELRRRQMGFGRGGRMKIERDRAEVIGGTRKGVTTGGPLALLIRNRDYRIENIARVDCPRPGHADLAGLLKYGFTDVRDVLERASARSTAATVALGACAKLFLSGFRIAVSSAVVSIAGETGSAGRVRRIAGAMKAGDTVGGIFEVTARGIPPGLGSYVQPDRRLDGRIAQSLMAIPGVKGVEIGLGFGYAGKPGSQVHDPIYYVKGKGWRRGSNNAGGIEGGISNGEPVVARACMKPIATLLSPLASVNIGTKRSAKASVERSDICAVEPAAVVAESCLALVLADAMLEKFGSDDLTDIHKAFAAYLKRIR